MNEKLLRYLVEKGLLTTAQANALRAEQQTTLRPIRELISERGLIADDQLLEALSAVSRVPSIRLYEHAIPMNVRQLVRPELLRSYVMIPFAFDPDDAGTLYVAMNDPMNMKGRDLIALASKCRIRPFLASTSDILLSIDRCYGTDEMQEAVELYTQTSETDRSVDEQILQEDINSSPVVVLVNSLVEQAVRQRASDIHIETEADRVRVRFRVDGVLFTASTYDMRLHSAIVARVKVISGLDISEKRKPQDGRFSATVDHREYEIRVSTLPTVYGVK